MNDKEKQIEEMAQTMCEFSHSSGKCDCVNSFAPNCTWKNMATSVYNAGYRKLPEDSVVLTREEYERLNKKIYDFGMEIELNLNQIASLEREVDHFKSHCDFMEDKKDEWLAKYEKVCKQLTQVCKKTVEKILKLLDNMYVKEDDRHYWREHNNDCIDKCKAKISKQFGVHIKE